MNITGPIQSNITTIQESTDQFLKVNQRIAGEIIHISNDQVVLSVNGVQIVAKMTSSEQLALLMDKRYAYFIVKDLSENQITLQIANAIQPSFAQKNQSESSLGRAILEQLGINSNKENLNIVQAALNQGLKITQNLLNEINQALEHIPNWGSREAQLAVAIKSAGLPLTPGSLVLAKNSVKDLKQNFLAVFEQIEIAVNKPGISAQTYQSLRSLQEALKNVIIQSGNTNEIIEKNISDTVQNLGQSLENEIAIKLNPDKDVAILLKTNDFLFRLANLRHEYGSLNSGRLGDSIDNFIQGMRWMHFVNVEPDQPLLKGQWTQLDLPISFGFHKPNSMLSENVHDLQIRIAHDGEENSVQAINSDYTRLVIQVDLDNREMIKVDLSIVSKLIGAEIIGTSELICLNASEELSELQTGLANLGYTLKTSRVEIGNLQNEIGINEKSGKSHTLSSVDLGV